MQKPASQLSSSSPPLTSQFSDLPRNKHRSSSSSNSTVATEEMSSVDGSSSSPPVATPSRRRASISSSIPQVATPSRRRATLTMVSSVDGSSSIPQVATPSRRRASLKMVSSSKSPFAKKKQVPSGMMDVAALSSRETFTMKVSRAPRRTESGGMEIHRERNSRESVMIPCLSRCPK